MARNFRNPSVMKHDFSNIPSVNIQRSVFNRSSGYKTTFDSGYLIPFFVDEALPGDTFHMRTSMLARLTTPIVPIMDNMKLDYFFFSVPNRLVWDNWQKFMGEQKNPGDSVDYVIPQIRMFEESTVPEASMADYFGIPTNVPGLNFSALPFRAYNLIYNEWFRDQNLCDSVHTDTSDHDQTGDVFSEMYALRRRGKRHDYFTSCLPWPQKGDGVELSLGTPPVIDWGEGDNPVNMRFASRQPDGLDTYANLAYGIHDGNGTQVPGVTATDPENDGEISFGSPKFFTGFDPSNPPFTLDTGTQQDALTINSLRQAFQLQRLLERDARGGTRYTEIIRSHFGVISPDARLQRPEYLGGGTMDININPVLQTSASDTTSPQGNLAAYGVSGGVKNGFSHSFTEHCIVIGLVCVRADLTYQQGIPRMFSRETRFDHYWPTLAHLGEQAVLNKEIYAQGPGVKDADGNPVDDGVFGYQERFAEYRYAPSKITGKMRSTAKDTLDVWHLSQKFETLPTLNKQFIEENPPIKRVIAVQDEPEFLLDVYFDLKCARPMPVYSVPGYIDHF